ncbi:hypothetical protein LEAN103870_12110 [Legionella anisa]|uniref:Uncharacterized protein n=2 Tax=Legionella anisa TaxID=28082 RepID=A0AAX0WRQ3_9GAMM|nr:hypothetical protein [Legionella anisa]AWN75286.1 hypothetical protein DLD14_16410 [Legionella anisa]KTC72649.1 hypothetical protein Lani_0873 [Legionella anisa]MBN5935466.1 hypothetical protein [Legionella anisa]MCW8424542.1 hypothetical protein [Legionella anisa]PNL60810.1 hypothetical protein A6J39_006020 [Legionella anisa]
MDAIQLALDVHLKRTIYNSQRFFFKQHELSEATYPLLISYLAWLRKINATPNKIDVMHQNEQKNREFKFLCKRNLLFFLTITGQFNVIEKLFKTPSLTTKLHHLIALIKKERYKIRRKKSTLLKATCSPKAKTRNPEQKHNAYCLPTMGLFKQDIKKPLLLSFEYPVRRINIFYLAYSSKIELLRKILKTIQTNPNLQSHIKKTLLHQIATVHRRALKNKALFTTPINQNAPTPRILALIRQAWKQLNDDVLEINSIFNQCKCLSSELEKINRDELTASMKHVDELENLMQEHYELHDEINKASEVRGDAEQRAEVYTQSHEDWSTAVEFGKSSTIKNSLFVSHHLTFFSPPQKNEKSMSLEPNVNFNEQKIENSIRAGF